MSDLRQLLNREAQRIAPTTAWVGPMLGKVNRRRRLRRLYTGALSLAIAAVGFLIAVRAFERAPSGKPISPSGSNYHFHDISVRQGEGPDQVMVYFAMRFEGEPGIHECTWRAYGPEGELVGERTLLVGYERDLPDPRSNAVELNASGMAVRGEAFCDPTRLDTPGISDVEPYPPGLEVNLAQRIKDWASRFQVMAMSEKQLEANIQALRLESATVARQLNGPGDSEASLRFEELRLRIVRLEQELAGDVSPVEEDSAAEDGEVDRELPAGRLVLAEGEHAGTDWEIFVLDRDGRPVFGWALSTGDRSTSEIVALDPCLIESRRINWVYLEPLGGYPVWSPPDRVVVLQTYALPPEADEVRFVLSDGRSIGARILRIPDERAPWDAFVVVFETSPEVNVNEVIIESADGSRLDAPERCGP
jgi:hypothetical protein